MPLASLSKTLINYKITLFSSLARGSRREMHEGSPPGGGSTFSPGALGCETSPCLFLHTCSEVQGKCQSQSLPKKQESFPAPSLPHSGKGPLLRGTRPRCPSWTQSTRIACTWAHHSGWGECAGGFQFWCPLLC